MKTKLFFFLLFLLSVSLMAQTEEQADKINPQKGNFAIELDFLPFSDNGPIDLKAFRGRVFLKENFALRTGFNFDYKKSTDEIPRTFMVDGNSIMLMDKEEKSYTILGVDLGLEYHLLDSKRVSPYVGIEIGYENKASKYSDEVNHVDYYPYTHDIVKTEIENAWKTLSVMYYDQWGQPYFSKTIGERAYSSFKVNLVAGADVYLFKHLYMGVELGLGMDLKKYKEATIKADGVLTSKYPEIKDNNIGLNFNNAIRLGFWF
nr:outer membrane beta-barrel protein [Bacteroidota bacterium]